MSSRDNDDDPFKVKVSTTLSSEVKEVIDDNYNPSGMILASLTIRHYNIIRFWFFTSCILYLVLLKRKTCIVTKSETSSRCILFVIALLDCSNLSSCYFSVLLLLQLTHTLNPLNLSIPETTGASLDSRLQTFHTSMRTPHWLWLRVSLVSGLHHYTCHTGVVVWCFREMITLTRVFMLQ